MKVQHGKDVANHSGPESCGAAKPKHSSSPGKRGCAWKTTAPTSSPLSPSAAKARPPSWPTGPPNSRRRTGPAATPPLLGPSTARARGSNRPLPPTCSSKKPSISSAMTRTKLSPPATPARSKKGQRLGRLVGQRRGLLILDGLEPLQYAPTAPTPGELKDQGLAALLKGLARRAVDPVQLVCS
jgi:hypothetical protein